MTRIILKNLLPLFFMRTYFISLPASGSWSRKCLFSILYAQMLIWEYIDFDERGIICAQLRYVLLEEAIKSEISYINIARIWQYKSKAHFIISLKKMRPHKSLTCAIASLYFL